MSNRTSQKSQRPCRKAFQPERRLLLWTGRGETREVPPPGAHLVRQQTRDQKDAGRRGHEPCWAEAATGRRKPRRQRQPCHSSATHGNTAPETAYGGGAKADETTDTFRFCFSKHGGTEPQARPARQPSFPGCWGHAAMPSPLNNMHVSVSAVTANETEQPGQDLQK